MIPRLRDGKKLEFVDDEDEFGVNGILDPVGSLKSGIQFPKRILEKPRISGLVTRKEARIADAGPDIFDHDDDDDVAAINDSLNNVDDQGHNVNKQFKAILSKLSSDFRSKIKIEKANADSDHENLDRGE